MHAIQANDFEWIQSISSKCLRDDNHYIHKAFGWMMRILGDRDIEKLRKYLEKFAWEMPRISLRYAIEKMSVQERKYFLSK
jgi:3-methyladenine DNA glycosylase AlkD